MATSTKDLEKELRRAVMRAEAAEALNKELHAELEETHAEIERLKGEEQPEEEKLAAKEITELKWIEPPDPWAPDTGLDDLMPHQRVFERYVRLMDDPSKGWIPPRRGGGRSRYDLRIIEQLDQMTVDLEVRSAGRPPWRYRLKPGTLLTPPKMLREAVLKASYELLRNIGAPDNPADAARMADEFLRMMKEL